MVILLVPAQRAVCSRCSSKVAVYLPGSLYIQLLEDVPRTGTCSHCSGRVICNKLHAFRQYTCRSMSMQHATYTPVLQEGKVVLVGTGFCFLPAAAGACVAKLSRARPSNRFQVALQRLTDVMLHNMLRWWQQGHLVCQAICRRYCRAQARLFKTCCMAIWIVNLIASVSFKRGKPLCLWQQRQC